MTINIDLKGKTVIVTGATGQLGQVMVKTLALAGANVAIHFKNNYEKGVILKSEIEKMGQKAYLVQADIQSISDVQNMKDELLEKFSLPDIVISNAVSQIFPWRNVLDENIEDYEDQFKSCVMQNVYMAKTFIPHMQKLNWGRYIAINTECTIQTLETQSAYVSGKRGMDGLLRVLAKEVGPDNITVNQVAPGWTISDNDRLNNTEKQPDYDKNIPLRRRGTDQEIANVVLFLASHLSSYITGSLIPVNGGNANPSI